MNITTNEQKSSTEKYCSDCGEIINVKAEICPKCGVRQMAAPVTVNPNAKSRGVAILLALFLGGLGAHRFYLGQIGLGLFYLIFCWTLIPAFIALIDLIILILMSDKSFAERYEAV